MREAPEDDGDGVEDGKPPPRVRRRSGGERYGGPAARNETGDDAISSANWRSVHRIVARPFWPRK